MESIKRTPPERVAWLWLVLGAAFLPFTAWQTVVPVAAWLAPVFLLRFMRTAKNIWLARLLVFFAYVLSIHIASRGMPFSPLGELGNVIVKSSAWALPYSVDRLLAGRLRYPARTLVFPLAFTTVEWAISLCPITSSGSIAYSQVGNLALLQILSITGTFGVTFLITWFASVVNELWERRFNWQSMRKLLAAFAGILAATFLFGFLRMSFAAPSSPTVPTAAITIEGGLSDHAVASIDWMRGNWVSEAQREALRRFFEPTAEQALVRSQAALRDGSKLVGWQESGVWILEEDESRLVQRVSQLAAQYGAYVAASMEVLIHAKKLPVLRNESILVDPSGNVLWTYDKSHPVPYDEAFATIAGPGRLPIVDTGYGRMSAAICYDTYFPSLIRQAGIGGTDIFIAPTNDPRPYAESMAMLASCRAIENGFSMVRPTGHGISAMIDYEGRFIASQDFFTSPGGVLEASLPARGIRTIYSRIGDAFAYLGAAVLAGLAVAAVVRAARRRHATL